MGGLRAAHRPVATSVNLIRQLSENRVNSPLSKQFAGAVAVATCVFLLLGSGALASTGKAGPARADAKQSFPRSYALANDRVGHWAVVLRNVAAHRQPNASSPAVTTLDMVTGDGTQNVVLILGGLDVNSKETWYKVRLPILPNNSTGWVRRSALGNVHAVHTHLYVDRATFTATLKRDGRTIFTTESASARTTGPPRPGSSTSATSSTGFTSPVYGPLAFGTSARSNVLTDWPGGGFIGVHGTNEPQILPGAVSHGCIRMLNDEILRLSKLMNGRHAAHRHLRARIGYRLVARNARGADEIGTTRYPGSWNVYDRLSGRQTPPAAVASETFEKR